MAKKKVSDISQKVIVVLLVMAILVSAIGTWAVLDTLSNLEGPGEIKVVEETSGAYGQVGLTIAEPPAEDKEDKKEEGE